MQETREAIIEKYYTNIQLDKNYLEIYVVRKAILEAIKSNLHKFKGTVLDVGCGIMPYREMILQNKQVTRYTGLDFESALHEEYAKVKPDLVWEGSTINLESNSVDTILATEVLEHCAEPEKVLAEIFRVLKPGGVFFFTVPFLWNIHLVPYDEYRYTSFALKRLLSQEGFSDIDLRSLGGLDASLAQMIGIWYKNRPFGSKKRLSFLFKWSIKFLLKKDQFFDRRNIYSEGIMVTGFCGTAIKM